LKSSIEKEERDSKVLWISLPIHLKNFQKISIFMERGLNGQGKEPEKKIVFSFI